MTGIITHLTGCDGVGKSTLAQNVAKALELSVTHFDKPKDMADGKQQYFDFLQNLKPEDSVVCDRFHDGEWVYAPLYRGYTADYLHEFEVELVKNHNYLLVYVTAQLEEIIRRTRIRGEDFVKEEDFQTVLNLFEGWLQQQAMPWVEVDTTYNDPQACVQLVLDAKAKVERIWNAVRNCTKNCTGILEMTYPRGNLNADYMIVGQNPGGQDKRDHSTAFGDGPAASFLMDVLRQAGILRNCWITNEVICPSHDNKIKREYATNCNEYLQLQLEIIQPKKVVVLGGDTAKFLDASVRDNFEVVELKHPAYVRRFESKHVDAYVAQFKALKGE